MPAIIQPCMILGDSLAVGVAAFRPNCLAVAQVGISSTVFVNTKGLDFEPAQTALISLGANDWSPSSTLLNLRRLRAEVVANKVYWLIPHKSPQMRAAIIAAAADHGDFIIDTAPLVGPDDLHPTQSGYKKIADTVLPLPQDGPGCPISGICGDCDVLTVQVADKSKDQH